MQEVINNYGATSKSQIWIREIQQQMDFINADTSYRLLKAVLHALRDQMSLAEMAYFAGQLPLLLRGTFYEGWNPYMVNLSSFTKEDFLQSVRNHLELTGKPQFELETGVLVALNVIKKHLHGAVKEQYVSISDNIS